MRRVLVIALSALLCACSPSVSHASQSAMLQASLTPEHLGQETTFGFAFEIEAPRGQAPSPLVSVGLSYPKDLGVTISELGLATCTVAELQAHGLRVCPGNSRMGRGSATVEIPIGPMILSETAHIDVVRAPQQEGHMAVIFNIEGTSPVGAEIAIPSVLLSAQEPFGGVMSIQLPTVPSLPEAPDVAVVDLQAFIGPSHLIYHERVHGRTIAFRPHGIKMPRHCPRQGFPFAATFAFMDGTRTAARTVVPCPHAHPSGG